LPLDTFLGPFTYSSSTSKVTKTSDAVAGYNGVAYTSSAATRYDCFQSAPSSFAHSARTRPCLFSICPLTCSRCSLAASRAAAIPTGTAASDCTRPAPTCAPPPPPQARPAHVPCLAPSLVPPSHRRRTNDAPPHCSQPSPSRIFCTDTLPNGHTRIAGNDNLRIFI
jgi:hypothetical protein